jgi:glycosyltransferase involved in cell wall biosynthesis
MKYTEFKQFDVVVGMITYNHGEYIEQAIESVLMQKTTFNFALIINDDCSSDKTQQICEGYQTRFPDRVFYHRNKVNLGFSKNGLLNYEQCYLKSHKYIALLEGDDFWLIDNKLQSQFDLLENEEYSDCVLCSTNYIEYFEDKMIFGSNWAYFNGVNDELKNKGDIFRLTKEDGWKTKTATNFFRKKGLKLSKLKRYNLLVDTILVYELNKNGKSLFFNNCTAAYRIQSQGNWGPKSTDEKKIISKRIFDEIKSKNFFNEVVIKKLKKRQYFSLLYSLKKQYFNFKSN